MLTHRFLDRVPSASRRKSTFIKRHSWIVACLRRVHELSDRFAIELVAAIKIDNLVAKVTRRVEVVVAAKVNRLSVSEFGRFAVFVAIANHQFVMAVLGKLADTKDANGSVRTKKIVRHRPVNQTSQPCPQQPLTTRWNLALSHLNLKAIVSCQAHQ